MEGLIQWMKRQAQSYRDWALATQNRYRLKDAEDLLDWIEDLDFSDIEEGLAKDPVVFAAVISPVERMTKHAYTQEEDRWDDIVDWVCQIPGSLEGYLELYRRRPLYREKSRPSTANSQQEEQMRP